MHFGKTPYYTNQFIIKSGKIQMKKLNNYYLLTSIIFLSHLTHSMERNPYLYKIPQGIVKKICGKQKRNLQYYEKLKRPKKVIQQEHINKKKNLQEQLNKISEFIVDQTRNAAAQDLISLANNVIVAQPNDTNKKQQNA